MTQFEEAFAKNRRAMYQAVRRMGYGHARAEDSVQKAAERLAQMNTISYVEERRVSGLFCAAARFAAIDLDRTQKSQDRLETEVSVLKSIPERLTKKDRETTVSITVHRALSRLTEIESYVAWKYWAVEQSLREISEDLLDEKGIDWDHNKLFRFIPKLKAKLKGILVELGGDKI